MTIWPAETPTYQIAGAILSTNALIWCDPAVSGGKRLCPDVTVNGQGPQTVTVKLFGKALPTKTQGPPPASGQTQKTKKKPGGG